MNLPPPPQDDDPIITEFTPRDGQWDLNDDNMKLIDPETGQTILHNYCQHINASPLAVYRFLIEVKGYDVDIQDKYNDTPVHDAFRYFDPNEGGDITVLRYLLTQNNVNLNAKGYNNQTLLHTACNNINALSIEIFKLLIEKHADVNVQDDDNNTPIHRALYCFDPNDGGDITVLNYLLSQEDVNLNIKGYNGSTLLHTACNNINGIPLDIFKVLIEKHGGDVNTQDNNNNTPLHNALGCFDPNDGGDITVLTYLLSQKDVNLNIKGEKGCNLLHSACTNNLPSYRRSVELDAECDTVLCQIVEYIIERCVQEVLDGNNLK